jgi:integrase
MPSATKLERTRTKGVYKRGARYCVIFRDQTGRQRRRAARTLKEAEKLKAALSTDVERGEFVDSRVTFAEHVPKWIATYKGRTKRGIRPETLADYRTRLGLDVDGRPLLDEHGNPRGAFAYFGRMRLSHIRPANIKEYAVKIESRGVSAGTVRLDLAPVKAMLADAFEEGLIRSNPAAGVRVVVRDESQGDEEPERVKALFEEELRAFLDTLSADPDEKGWDTWRLFFEFLAHTGLRIGEAIALRWQDVDLGQQRVRVRRRYYRGRFDAPKSKHGRRDVRLSAGLSQALWELRKEQRPQDEELVFRSQDGHLIDQSNLMARVLKPAAVHAGLGEWIYSKGRRRRAESWVGFHTFRHTCATLLFRHGLNAKQVQVWLGHHSPAFTLATYVHLLADDLPEADFLDTLTTCRSEQGDNKETTSPAESGREAGSPIVAISGNFSEEPRAAETAVGFS